MKSLALIFLFVFFVTPQALAHSRLLPGGNIPPRSNNAGLKNGPCGGIAKGNPVATFNRGQTITVQWEETINHPGYFEFSISSDNDVNFTMLTSVTDTQNTSAGLPHQYQVNLTLPANLTCTNCTLRLVQQMTENPQNPVPYFSCADIAIADTGVDTPTDPVDPSPTPSPTPVDGDCHN